MVCSSETLLEKQLKHLKHVFHKINGYLWWIIDQVNKSNNSEHYTNTSEQPAEKMHSLLLPYAAPKGNSIIKTMNNILKCILLNRIKVWVFFGKDIEKKH